MNKVINFISGHLDLSEIEVELIVWFKNISWVKV